jgi:hypothetical protein
MHAGFNLQVRASAYRLDRQRPATRTGQRPAAQGRCRGRAARRRHPVCLVTGPRLGSIILCTWMSATVQQINKGDGGYGSPSQRLVRFWCDVLDDANQRRAFGKLCMLCALHLERGRHPPWVAVLHAVRSGPHVLG